MLLSGAIMVSALSLPVFSSFDLLDYFKYEVRVEKEMLGRVSRYEKVLNKNVGLARLVKMLDEKDG